MKQQLAKKITEAAQEYAHKKPIKDTPEHLLDFNTIMSACQLMMFPMSDDSVLLKLPIVLPTTWVNFIRKSIELHGAEPVAYVLSKILVGGVATMTQTMRWKGFIKDYNYKLSTVQNLLKEAMEEYNKKEN